MKQSRGLNMGYDFVCEKCGCEKFTVRVVTKGKPDIFITCVDCGEEVFVNADP